MWLGLPMPGKMRFGCTSRHALACLAVIACIAALAGCGGSAAGTGPGPARPPPKRRGEAPLVDWPLFGRVPERTHYLPAERRALDPPLREAWSINTHALIEFPPAVAGGVAYVVNKYGNAQSGAAARPQGALGTDHRPERRRARRPTSPRPSTTAASSSSPTSTASWSPSTPTSGKQDWARNLHSHLESSPMAVGGTPLPRHRQHRRGRPARLRRQGPLAASTRPARSKPAPATTTGASTSPTTRASMFCLDAEHRQAGLAHQHEQGAALRRGRLLLLAGDRLRPRLRRPRRRHRLRLRRADRQGRLVLPDRRLRLRLAGRRQGPRHARRPSTSAPTTSTSTRSTRAAASSAGDSTSAAPVPGTATVIGHTVYTSSFKTDRTIGIDVRTHRKTFEMRPGRLHAGRLRRPAPLPDRLLRADRPRADGKLSPPPGLPGAAAPITAWSPQPCTCWSFLSSLAALTHWRKGSPFLAFDVFLAHALHACLAVSSRCWRRAPSRSRTG